MANKASEWFTTSYQKGVIHDLQSTGFLLKGMAQHGVKVTGSKVRWMLAQKREAQRKSQVVEMVQAATINKSYEEAEMEEWDASSWILADDLEKMDVNQKDEEQRAAAMALGRKFDEIHIKELLAAALPGGNIISAPTANIKSEHALKLASIVRSKGNNHLNEIYCPLPAQAFDQLMLYKEFSSSDYIGADLPFAKMTQKKTWRGVNWFEVPDSLVQFDNGFGEEAVIGDASSFTAVLWSKSALGFACNYDLKSMITYENTHAAWLARNFMSGKAKVLLPGAIAKGTFKFNGALERNV
jgi:hypothetical protein